jgi:hypothetical protein
MRSPIRFVAALSMSAVLVLPALALAQAPEPPRPPRAPNVRGPELVEAPWAPDQKSAADVRSDLRELLSNYPPTVGQTLRLDPGLMTNQAYLAPYPNLTAFLQRHPEVVRNPDYFLNFVNFEGTVRFASQSLSAPDELKARALRTYQDIFMSTLVLCGFLAGAFAIGYVLRAIMGHRRWLRTFRAQNELQNRLLERFGTSQELLAYLQSPSGGAPLLPVAAPEGPAPVVGAPLGRILWAVQAGVVLLCAGFGLLLLKHYVMPELADMLLVPGVLAVSLGIGFVLAGAASYILSRRFGLLEASVARAGQDAAL